MPQFNLNPNLDQRFRQGIENQGDILHDLDLTITLLTAEIIAPNPLFSVRLQEHDILPVFTTESDWQVFMDSLDEPPAELTWNAVPLGAFWGAFMGTSIDTIAFNLKTSPETATGNFYYFEKNKLNEFLERNSKLVNSVVNEENARAAQTEKTYFVPLFQVTPAYGEILRAFPVLSLPDEQSYIPIFDNLDSFALWYNHPELSKPFKDGQGVLRAFRVADLLTPSVGTNEFGTTSGLVVNPMEVNPEKDKGAFMLWEKLKAD